MGQRDRRDARIRSVWIDSNVDYRDLTVTIVIEATQWNVGPVLTAIYGEQSRTWRRFRRRWSDDRAAAAIRAASSDRQQCQE